MTVLDSPFLLALTVWHHMALSLGIQALINLLHIWDARLSLSRLRTQATFYSDIFIFATFLKCRVNKI